MKKKEVSFLKKQQKKTVQKLSFWQSLSSTVTNWKYDMTKQYFEMKQKIFQPQEDKQDKTIIIQGKRYYNRTQAKQIVNKIMWFSYRKGFNIKNQYASDVGWGCLVRVGQMALASALLKNYQSQKHLSSISFDSHVQTLIAAFSDFQGRQQRYSLIKIIEIASKQFGQKAGQWFDLSKISYCLRILQNKNPMKGSQNLKIAMFDQVMNIPTLLKIQNLKTCNCAKKKIVCEKCHSDYKPYENELITIKHPTGTFQTISYISNNSNNSNNNEISFSKKKKATVYEQKPHGFQTILNKQPQNLNIFRNKRLRKDILVVIVTRAVNQKSKDEGQQQNLNKAIFSLLDLHICLGIMTGFPKQAIFIVGRQENKLIYLNPHYVQENIGLDNKNIQSYFCEQYLTTDRKQLDPSMAFCFYIQNLAQLQLLANAINRVNTLYREALSLGIDSTNYPFKMSDYVEQQQQMSSDLASVASFLM